MKEETPLSARMRALAETHKRGQELRDMADALDAVAGPDTPIPKLVEQGAVSEVEQRELQRAFADVLLEIEQHDKQPWVPPVVRAYKAVARETMRQLRDLLALVADLRQQRDAPLVHVPRSDEELARVTIPYAEYLELGKLRQQQEQLPEGEWKELDAALSMAQFTLRNGTHDKYSTAVAVARDQITLHRKKLEAAEASLTALRREQEQLRTILACDADERTEDAARAIVEVLSDVRAEFARHLQDWNDMRGKLEATEATGAAAVSQLRAALAIKVGEWGARARVLKDEHFAVAAEELLSILDAAGSARPHQTQEQESVK